MSEVIETVVYKLDELSDTARETARAWYRDGGVDYDWYDAVYEDFIRICDILGVRLKLRPVRLYGGGTRHTPCIYFRGFWSQGDGACFEGQYAYRKGACRQIKGYAPQDTDLHDIADTLQDIQRRNFYQLNASVRHQGHYYHEYSMVISLKRDSPTCQDMTADAESTVSEALRDLASWLYRQLEHEYDHLNSDEVVDKVMMANDYTFTACGRRFG
ncbi:antitoxin of toxin-antitoxin stability system [Asticcacaulis tiandongensis]|uniref:antitoxin of toxin-antitoxin stability system n=1 Tax=Asticcacaulis tiandongensis TaxID=2565365 RepID=UPI0011293CA5|nr:antitoxin of toxin-antitoxin stability system [Asticcacaulis tiandongensis]